MRNARGSGAGRRLVNVLFTFGLVGGLIGWTSGPAAATAVSNTGTITIPDSGQATPYPSTISVPGSGIVADVNVTIPVSRTHVRPTSTSCSSGRPVRTSSSWPMWAPRRVRRPSPA